MILRIWIQAHSRFFSRDFAILCASFLVGAVVWIAIYCVVLGGICGIGILYFSFVFLYRHCTRKNIKTFCKNFCLIFLAYKISQNGLLSHYASYIDISDF